MSELGWKTWMIRFAITMAGTAIIAWTVSFAVADYVVRANTSGASETMRALQSSIDRLNESVIANSGRLDAFTTNMSTLMERSATTAVEISSLRQDISRVQTAVQGAGIDIRIGGAPDGKQLNWSDIKAFYGVEEGVPLFFEVANPPK